MRSVSNRRRGIRRRDFLLGFTACAACRRAAAQSALGTVAYVQPDGLWVRELPAGAPRRLTTAPVDAPRFSPSGRWIAFDGGVVTTSGDSTAMLGPGPNSWLPHDDVLAVCRPDGVALFNASAGWRNPVTILRGVSDCPIFSPDGTQYVFQAVRRTGTGPGGEPLREGQLRRASVGGRSAETLVAKDLIGFIPFAWTPDSRYVLYWEDLDFSASLQADGLELFRVPSRGGTPQSLKVSGLVHNDLLAFSPDGRFLATTDGGGRETWHNKRIALLDLSTLAITYRTGANTSAVEPAWSPDGKRMAFSQMPAVRTTVGDLRPYVRPRRIFMADALSSSPPVAITADPLYRDEEPLWSGDGSHLLFCRVDSSYNLSLWLIGGGGENPVRVSGPLRQPNADSPAFAPGLGFYGYIDWRRIFDWHSPSR